MKQLPGLCLNTIVSAKSMYAQAVVHEENKSRQTDVATGNTEYLVFDSWLIFTV